MVHFSLPFLGHYCITSDSRRARENYRQFLQDGIELGSRPELVGRKGDDKECADAGDDRVLGGSGFLDALRGEISSRPMNSRALSLEDLAELIAHLFHLSPEGLRRRGRQNQYSEARDLFCYLAVHMLGYTGASLGAKLNIGVSSVSRSLRRGQALMDSRPDLQEWWGRQVKQ